MRTRLDSSRWWNTPTRLVNDGCLWVRVDRDYNTDPVHRSERLELGGPGVEFQERARLTVVHDYVGITEDIDTEEIYGPFLGEQVGVEAIHECCQVTEGSESDDTYTTENLLLGFVLPPPGIERNLGEILSNSPTISSS